MARLMSRPRRPPTVWRTRPSPCAHAARPAARASSVITQRVVAAPFFSTTASTIRLPAYARPSGNRALTSVKPAIATVPPRADFHTRPSARGVYSKLPRSAALHEGGRELLGLGGTMEGVRLRNARRSLPGRSLPVRPYERNERYRAQPPR